MWVYGSATEREKVIHYAEQVQMKKFFQWIDLKEPQLRRENHSY